VTAPVLRLTGLFKSFSNPGGDDVAVVDVPAFSLASQEQVGIRGASGSGKTTFLNLIAGILKADRGQIVIGGTDLASLSESGRDRFRAAQIGYVFQSFNLLQGYTALENVLLGMLFGPGPDVSRARRLLDQLGLSHRLQYRPAQLSIGQQQRVALARALANRPQLVLADEPTGNLDQERTADAIGLIRDTCSENQAALLLVSHDPTVTNMFRRVEDMSVLNRAGSMNVTVPSVSAS
jgi:putative ABC transport system ATP-binding protein